MRIAIVGVGPAGLAAAIALRQQLDADVTLFERADALKPVGAGVLIQPIGQAVLDRLGLGDAIRANGSRADRLFGTAHDGRVVLDLEYAKLGDNVFGVGIARRRLHRVLVDAAKAAGATIVLGAAIDAVRDGTNAVELLEQGESRGSFAAVVLAGGARSQLRESAGLACRIRPYPWGAVWATVPCAGGSNVLRQHFRRAKEMLGLLPSGEAIDGEPPLVTIFWSLPPGGYERWRAAPLAAWKDQVGALAPDALPDLEPITDHDAMNRAWYADVRVAQPHRGRVLAIGDCAHAMSPQLGQGVNLALLDAYTLAAALRAQPRDIESAFASYARKRKAHVGYYQWASRFLTPLFQSDATVLPWLRDRFGRMGFGAPWIGRQSLYTLAGTKTGILAASRDAASLLHRHEFP